jgi:hypothetical protein
VTTRYTARLSPIGPDTVWVVEDATLIEQRGKSRRVLPLAMLSELTLNTVQPGRPYPSLVLRFGWRRLTVPGASFSAGGVRATPEDFAAFVRKFAPMARSCAPGAPFRLGGRKDRRGPLVWAIVLLGAGAIGLALTALGSVTRSLGLSLAAWLAFAALLVAAVLPWLEATDAGFDPEAIPDALFARGA